MRKNVLILGHNDATPFVDIYNQYTKLFNKNKYEVTVAYLTGDPNEETKKRTLAENIIFLNLPKRSIRSLKINAIKTLLTLTREKQFQIVICHRYKPIYTMLWVAKFHKIPALIAVMHELGTMSSIHRRMLIACLAGENVLLAGVSNAVRDDLRKNAWHIPKERIITLYNAIDVELTEPQLLNRETARKNLQLLGDAFVFGNLGRLATNKDQESLIHAFSLIRPYCPTAKLMIIGTGELESRLKQQVESHGLKDDVLFTGFLTNGFRYMKAFDCFVLSSIQEAFGRVLLEAMMAKLPIIATRVHGIPEVISTVGTLVEPKDIHGLATAMRKIYELSQATRNSNSEVAYQHLTMHFSIPRFYEQFWQLPLIQEIDAAPKHFSTML
ncbi:MAG: glycosyltransferase [Gammaproteobacteria bacterium]|nr:glycosyltransferase [Gammaproteobacteria bacterium]MCW5583001.1 glycosyltransferase [Gammaproteobacteria bacterium]